MMYAKYPIPTTGIINDSIAAGSTPKSLKLAGPIIEVIYLYLLEISFHYEYRLKKL